MNTVHHAESRMCVFESCDKKFAACSTSRNHFRIKHSTKAQSLKRVHLLEVTDTAPVQSGDLLPSRDIDESFDVGNEAEEYDFFDIDAVENPEPEMTDESEDFFLLYYADFMNRMAHYKFLPYSTVQEISEEYLKNSKKSQEICARK